MPNVSLTRIRANSKRWRISRRGAWSKTPGAIKPHVTASIYYDGAFPYGREAEVMFAAGPPRTPRLPFADGATGSAMLFHGAMVSTMILIPPNTLSISLCTRPVSDFRNSCNCWSSDVSPSRSLIELEVNRATEDRIRSASFTIWGASFGTSCSTSLPISASISASTESDFSASAEGVGTFIAFPTRGFGFSDRRPQTLFPICLTMT
jgi:hypothetical protein